MEPVPATHSEGVTKDLPLWKSSTFLRASVGFLVVAATIFAFVAFSASATPKYFEATSPSSNILKSNGTIELAQQSSNCYTASSCNTCQAIFGCEWCQFASKCVAKELVSSLCPYQSPKFQPPVYFMALPSLHSSFMATSNMSNIRCDFDGLDVVLRRYCPAASFSVPQPLKDTVNTKPVSIVEFETKYNEIQRQNTVPGFYVERGAGPLYFLPYPHDNGSPAYSVYTIKDIKSTSVFSLRIVAPPGKYSIGYSLAIKLNTGSVVCLYSPPTAVNHYSVVSTLYGWMNIVKIVASTVVLAVVILLVLLCQHNLKESPSDVSIRDKLRKLSEEDARPKSEPDQIRKINPHIGNRLLEVLYSVFLSKVSPIVDSCGTDAYFYISLNRYTLLLTFLIIPCTGLLVLNIMGRVDDVYLDFAQSTIAALGSSDVSQWIYLAVLAVFPILFIVLVALIRRLSKRVLVIPNSTVISVLQIYNIKSMSSTEFKAFCQHHWGEQNVLEAHVVLDVHALYKYSKKYQAIVDELVELRQDMKSAQLMGKNPLAVSKAATLCCCGSYDRVQYLEKQKLALESTIKQKQRQQKTTGSSGYGFIFFRDEDSARTCSSNLDSAAWKKSQLGHQETRMNLHRWIAKPAPAHGNIFWDNLGYSNLQRRLRNSTGLALLLGLMCFLYIYYIIPISFFFQEYAPNFLKTSVMTEARISFLGIPLLYVNWADSLFKLSNAILFIVKYGGMILGPLAPTIMSKVVGYVSRILLAPHSLSESRSNNISMSVLFTVFFTVLIQLWGPIYFYLYAPIPYCQSLPCPKPLESSTLFFNSSGIGIFSSSLDLLIQGKLLELGSLAVFLIVKLIIAKKKGTKVERPEYDHEASITLRTTQVLTMLYFGAVIPAVSFAVLLYIWIMFYVDKFLIMYYYRRSRDTDPQFLVMVSRSYYVFYLLYPPFMAVLFPRWVGSTITKVALIVFIAVTYLLIGAGILVTELIAKRSKSHFVRIGQVPRASTVEHTSESTAPNSSEPAVENLQKQAYELSVKYQHPLYQLFTEEELNEAIPSQSRNSIYYVASSTATNPELLNPLLQG